MSDISYVDAWWKRKLHVGPPLLQRAKRMNRYFGLAAAAMLLITAACNNVRTNAVADLPAVQQVLSNSRLSPQQKRTALADMGLDSDAINALLRDQRTANQNGGD